VDPGLTRRDYSHLPGAAGTKRPTCTRRFARGQRWYRDNREVGISPITPISELVDNVSRHKTPEIHRWLLRHPRFPSPLHAHLQLVDEPGMG